MIDASACMTTLLYEALYDFEIPARISLLHRCTPKIQYLLFWGLLRVSDARLGSVGFFMLVVAVLPAKKYFSSLKRLGDFIGPVVEEPAIPWFHFEEHRVKNKGHHSSLPQVTTYEQLAIFTTGPIETIRIRGQSLKIETRKLGFLNAET